MMMILLVTVPPHPLELSENIERPTAHTIRMTCYFDGVPTPNITWMKNGTVIKSNGRIKVKADDPDTLLISQGVASTLLISQGAASDSGLYQCWAQNAAGREGMIIRLHVKPSGTKCCHSFSCVLPDVYHLKFLMCYSKAKCRDSAISHMCTVPTFHTFC